MFSYENIDGATDDAECCGFINMDERNTVTCSALRKESQINNVFLRRHERKGVFEDY